MKKLLILLLCFSLILTACGDPERPPVNGQQERPPEIGHNADNTVVKVSGPTGGIVTSTNMEIDFPPEFSGQDISLSVTQVNEAPPIIATQQELDAYISLRPLGSIHKVSASQTQFDVPLMVTLTFDPEEFSKIKPDEMIIPVSVTDNMEFEMPEVLNTDFANGRITIETMHFSYIGVFIGTALVVGVLAALSAKYIRGQKLTKPWTMIEPNNPKIINYIKSNNIKLPDKRDPKGFSMEGFNKKFKARDGNMPYKGSTMLNVDEALCWDLTNLFGSILYNLASNPNNKVLTEDRIKCVIGTAASGSNTGDHVWIEAVIDGQPYVVDTMNPGSGLIKFIPRDEAYRLQNLKPRQTYSAKPRSLVPYDPNWYRQFMSNVQAEIDTLINEHRTLQNELESLNDGDISAADEARMNAIRKRQKEIYDKVMKLKSQLSSGS